jgi:transposase
MWRFKIEQVWEKACRTVAPRHGQEAATREVRRIVQRIDFVGDQLDQAATELRALLETFDEARYLSTLPGIGWVTVAALIAEIGPFDRYRHGRQLVKLAGLQPSRRESGEIAGSTPITKRGRAQLRAIVYMATLSAIQHNPRIKEPYQRLCQRTTRPLSKMQAFGACMTKFLLYTFAVVKRREAFDVDHLWKEAQIAA